jgi:hypothetical protein
MRKFSFTAIALIIHALLASSQSLSIGQWKAELPYRNAFSVTASNNKIYCATEISIYSVDMADNSIEELSKVTGLSDIESRIVAFDKVHNLLVVCYSNANIDILKDGQVINISDIERKNIVGDKAIYGVYFYGDYAYISCGFGIVVLNLLKYEIKDTYYIGPNGTNLQVNNVTCDGTYLYAATVSGLLRGELSDPNLVDFSHWYTFQASDGLIPGKFTDVVTFNGTVYTSKDDTVFQQIGTVWSPFLIRNGYLVYNMETAANDLLICQLNPLGSRVMTINILGEMDSISTSQPYQAIEEDGVIWIADLYEGLKKFANGYGEVIYPNGPWSPRVFDLAVNSSSHNLYVAPGGYNPSFGFLFNQDGFFTRTDDLWKHYDVVNTPILRDTFDIVCVTVNPANNRTYFGSLWLGIVEYDDSLGITDQFTDQNSTLSGTNGDITRVKATDIAFDKAGNMWVSNLGALVPICVRKTDGTWLEFQPPFPIDQQWITEIAFDDYQQVWFVLPRQGIMVYNYGDDLDASSDDKYKKLQLGPGLGNLPTLSVNCLATDKNGYIWVGCAGGVAVYYCPGDIFAEIPCDAQQIIITAADGYPGYLLGTENVKKIVVDGANRKWFATDNGVWLFSEDGTEEILHFTKDNSPLFSDFITSLDIDHSTGDVYIGTEKGILIYRGDAIAGSVKSCAPLVFPNPVRESYSGPIAITGVVNNADVKITDAEGNLIFRTTAFGGQVMWNGTKNNGDRAATGVYLVFASNEDGSVTCVTKLLVVN